MRHMSQSSKSASFWMPDLPYFGLAKEEEKTKIACFFLTRAGRACRTVNDMAALSVSSRCFKCFVGDHEMPIDCAALVIMLCRLDVVPLLTLDNQR